MATNEAVNAMLLNEFLKEDRKVEQQQAAIVATRNDGSKATCDSRPASRNKLKQLTAGLQKVSAQLQVSKPAPQVVNNP